MTATYEGIDDQTVAYILAVRTCFEDLKQVAAQLAGLLVLAAAGSSSATPDHPLLDSAEQVYKNAIDGLGSARVTVRARMHHQHLLRAAAKLGSALALMHHQNNPARLGNRDPLVLVRGAYSDLRSAAHALPGFQMISFERSCCAFPYTSIGSTRTA